MKIVVVLVVSEQHRNLETASRSCTGSYIVHHLFTGQKKNTFKEHRGRRAIHIAGIFGYHMAYNQTTCSVYIVRMKDNDINISNLAYSDVAENDANSFTTISSA